MRRYLDREKPPVYPGLGVGSFRICLPKPHKDIHSLLKIDCSVFYPGTASENLTSCSVNTSQAKVPSLTWSRLERTVNGLEERFIHHHYTKLIYRGPQRDHDCSQHHSFDRSHTSKELQIHRPHLPPNNLPHAHIYSKLHIIPPLQEPRHPSRRSRKHAPRHVRLGLHRD